MKQRSPVNSFSRAVRSVVVVSALAAGLGVLPLAGTGAGGSARAEEAVSPQTQAAVDRGLSWLAAKQEKDGHWNTGVGPSTAINSLAVMAFLARGHTPGQGPYGDHVTRGIDWVLSKQKPSGLLSLGESNHAMYDHGISSVMLAEACGMVDGPRRGAVELALGKAVKVILDAQKPGNDSSGGGWRYSPKPADADLSCTGWQLMALRGAANCGAAVPKDALDRGIAYVRRCSVNEKNGGGFAYQPGGGANIPRTGTGVLCLELLARQGRPEPTPEAAAGGEYLLKHPFQRGGEHFSYAAYYVSQAANQLGGKYWDGVYPKLRDTLLAAQQQDGRWNGDDGGGEPYGTATAVLALCVPYRCLPLYQK